MNPINIDSLNTEEKKRFQDNLDVGMNTSNSLGAITSASLSGSASPLSVPNVTPSTGAAGLSAFTTSYGQSQKALQDKLDKQAQEARIAKVSGKNDLLSTISDIENVQSSRNRLEEEAGIGIKAQQVTKYTNQLEALDRAEQNEIRALETANMTDVGRATASRDIQRKYAFEKADVALLQSAANRDYETASNIVNRKIELQLEPLRTKLEFQKLFYEENKDSFDKAEQRQFDSLVKATEKQYEDEKANKTAIANIQLEALKNGVTIPQRVLSELNGAKDINEAVSVLTRNGVSLSKPEGISTQIVDVGGRKFLINSRTGETIKEIGSGDVSLGDEKTLSQAQSDIGLIDSLVKDRNIRTAVGPSRIARFVGAGLDRLTGGRQNFIAGVEQLRSQLTLDSLIDAKARGATFGALSEGELRTLSASASKLGTWAKTNDNGEVTAYNVSEKDFKRELDKINNFAKLDYILRGGNPTDVGVTVMSDGSYVTENSDGSITFLR